LLWSQTVCLRASGRKQTHCPSLRWYMTEYGVPVEWCWLERIPVPLRTPKIPHVLPWARTRTSAVLTWYSPKKTEKPRKPQSAKRQYCSLWYLYRVTLIRNLDSELDVQRFIKYVIRFKPKTVFLYES
jgi:hypothetical protein